MGPGCRCAWPELERELWHAARAQMYDKDESGQIEFGEFLLMFRNSLLDLTVSSDGLLPERHDAGAAQCC